MTNQREIDTVNFFINNPDVYIVEAAKELSIPKSTIQRYLQRNGDRKTINGTTISEQLNINKAKGNKKGGDTYYKLNDFTKDSTGKFTGSKKTTTSDKLIQKEKDIKLISKYYLEHKDMSLEEVSSFFKEIELYTKSYVYDCLTSNRSLEVLGDKTYYEIQENLKKHRTSNIERGKK